MAIVTVVTADKSAQIEAGTIVGAVVDPETTRLELTTKGGGTIDGGNTTNIRLHDGSAYPVAADSRVFVGPADPGTVPDGCVWFDTSGT
ncbi:hypothetical protein SEA_MAYA_20 [Streptomyces phage Maya]|uniref:Uncharacterized protein n=7 Tax=Rimavirus rima TaxID=2560784 RepID=A0A515MIL8_9CAUD|nr:hypothetical protein SEA_OLYMPICHELADO_20 [Streptomyces phage OlympicHelado]ASU04016.1 hypothetical protein SEA_SPECTROPATRONM_20 [Streptomyces phage Spectropatronm]QAY16232.1 hypothetical protein SEA_ICEWARRIOR_20 [Streptomyces phage IceWarrior]QDM56521.1 hypothetical protein SEA_ESKETIT_20 [Streptomyces phage Esketit]QEQ93713.1 hypothetical protein SEA_JAYLOCIRAPTOR_20 [Streptomyces phage Jaylociraptor]QEQ94237.1 hypothetical protein SEA_HOSHI_20 [Streptomyces phage Hoshi]QNN98185.1 hypo